MNKNHKHFKLTEKNLSHIFEDHKKIAVWVAVFLVLILCVIILLFVDSENRVIKFSEDGENKIKNVLAIKENYEKQIKQILSNYIAIRESSEMLNKEYCKESVQKVFNDVLNLTVPVEYKDLHLRLVILLDKENLACGDYQHEKDKLNKEWEKIINTLN